MGREKGRVGNLRLSEMRPECGAVAVATGGAKYKIFFAVSGVAAGSAQWKMFGAVEANLVV